MIAGVILAAGESRRMGQPKQLLPFRGHTVLEQVIATYRAAVERLYVVLGHEADRIQARIRPLGVETLINARYRDGMITSVQCAVRALPPEAEAMLLGLSDQPLIQPTTLRRLIERYGGEGIAIPCHQGRRGHPVIIHRTYFPEILELTGSEGGLRALIHRHADAIRHVEVADPGILQDMDTPEDYRRIREQTTTGGES